MAPPRVVVSEASALRAQIIKILIDNGIAVETPNHHEVQGINGSRLFHDDFHSNGRGKGKKRKPWQSPYPS